MFYRPLWDVYEVAWAADVEERRRLTNHEAVIDRMLAGDLRSVTPDGPVNTLLANVPAAERVLNGPIVDVDVA